MRIAILGSGRMGGALGRAWVRAGHEVRFGVPDCADPAVLSLLHELGPAATAGSNIAAAQYGDAVVIATPWAVTQQVIGDCREPLAGKLVVDCTNPLLPDLSALALPADTSAAQQINRWAPTARVAKAFNAVAADAVGNALYSGIAASCFFCTDHDEDRPALKRLIAAAGLRPVDAGPLSAARQLETFALFWIYLAVGRGLGGDFALTIVPRSPGSSAH